MIVEAALLVALAHPVPEPEPVEFTEAVAPLPGLDGVHFATELTVMLLQSRRDGYNIGVSDGFRTYADQQAMVRKYGYYNGSSGAAAPGTSQHEFGLAVDLELGVGLLRTANRQWLDGHAWQFGLHFPVPGEPWHIEQVVG